MPLQMRKHLDAWILKLLIRTLKRGISHATLTKAKQPVSYGIGTA